MTNKKVIIIVLIFLIGGLLVYSFAATPSKPLEEDRPNSNLTDDDSDKDKEDEEKEKQEQEELVNLKKQLDSFKTTLSEEKTSGKYTEESLNEKEKLIEIAGNAKTKEEYEKALEDIKNFELVEKEEKPSITTPITNPSGGSNIGANRPSSGNNQGTTKPSGGNNQGSSSGNNPSKPSDDNKPSSGDNQGTATKPTEPVQIDKTELANIQNELDNAKNSDKYTDESLKELEKLIDAANNAKTKEEYEKALEDIKNFKLDEKIPTNIGTSNIEVITTPNNSSDKVNITSKQEGTEIILGGNIETNNSIENGIYNINVKVEAPRILSNEVLKNAKFKVMDNVYGFSTYEMPAYSRIVNIQNIESEKAYITIPSLTLHGDEILYENAPLRIAVDWGNNEYIIYNIYFNDITIIKQ